MARRMVVRKRCARVSLVSGLEVWMIRMPRVRSKARAWVSL